MENEESTHGSILKMLFWHAIGMTVFMSIGAPTQALAMGLDPNPWNIASIALNDTFNMISAPLSGLGDLQHITLSGDLTHEWSYGGHGAMHGALDTAAKGAHEVATHLASENIIQNTLESSLTSAGISLAPQDLQWLEAQSYIPDDLKANLAQKANFFGEPLQSFVKSWCAQNNISPSLF